MKKTLLLFLAVCFTGLLSFAQSNDRYYLDNRGRDARFAPRVGIGAGVFTFFGDVNDNNYQHIFTSTYGVEIRGSANLSRYFDLDLNAIYGNIAVNERSANRNFNFRSETFIGTAGVSYNFNHLYKRPGIIQPYIGVGVSFINFDSKSDMFDANGNRYYYWSDGSIMSLPETDANAENAIHLQRDYTYETDLRDENLDGLGKYEQFTFSIPVSFGVDFKLGKRLSSKLGAGFYYTFTDLIDDISTEGAGDRNGNSRNDMFLFTSLSVSYSIGVNKSYTKSQKEKYYKDIDFYALSVVDSDEDGVNDFDDACAQTPSGVAVDENGCPLDSDTDVIADYRDQEDSTKVGAVVDLNGVTLSEEAMLEDYADSLATRRDMMHKVYPSGILRRKKPITAEDSTKLALMLFDIQNDIEEEGEYDRLFQEMSNVVFSLTPKVASNVDDVYDNIDKVYNKMVKDKVIDPKRPLAITKEKNLGNLIPPEFQEADYNTDGLISASEVMRVVEKVLEGTTSLTISQLYNLIDFYKEYMEEATVIDFGGVKAVYIDGTLNILENFDDRGLSDTRRFITSKYKVSDYNNDGLLTPDEVNLTIERFKRGETNLTQEMINELIDLFLDK